MHENIIRPAEVTQASSGEDNLALTFAEEHAGNLRYVAAWGRWLAWDGTRWIFDDTLHTYDRVRGLCREVPTKASAQLVAAVERLARSDRRLAATADQWDLDPWLLNTPGGVIDLKTGSLRSHEPHDYLTKITIVTPDRNCTTPIWDTFLDRVTAGDIYLVGFLQRMAGYALSGSTQEHALFFLHGSGANGKSTFINAVTAILGDYHRAAAIETFTASHNERHPTDLAGLRGARLVTSVETEEGRRWAESKIKALTGGDKIAARFMRQDFFEFTPTFKLVIAGNHKPGLRSVDEAMRRRIHLVPFTVVIPSQERDKSLGDRLHAEMPGILAWMIDGCIGWQKRGLSPPKAVLDATAAYLEAEDAIAAWLDETGTRDLAAWEATKALFESWKTWADNAGEHAGTMKRFVQNLETRGLMPERKTQARGFRGFRLNLDR